MDRGVDPRICQTFAASPAEPGELPFWFRLRPMADVCETKPPSSGYGRRTSRLFGDLLVQLGMGSGALSRRCFERNDRAGHIKNVQIWIRHPVIRRMAATDFRIACSFSSKVTTRP
jgi:hypothetical protein